MSSPTPLRDTTSAVDTEPIAEAVETDSEPPSPTNANTKAGAAKPKRMFSWALLNFTLDAVLLAALLGLLWVSAVLVLVFPRATEADGWLLWGLSFDQWRNLQTAFLVIIALLALEHLVLHWTWVCGVVNTKILKLKNKPSDAVNYMYGIGFFYGMVILMAIGVIIAMLTVSAPPPPEF